jgi:hypothetical protein
MAFSHDVSHQKNQRSKNGPLPYCEAFFGTTIFDREPFVYQGAAPQSFRGECFWDGRSEPELRQQGTRFFSLEICKKTWLKIETVHERNFLHFLFQDGCLFGFPENGKIVKRL